MNDWIVFSGLRVGKMQMIAGLVTVLKKYRVELPQEAPKVLDYDPTSFATNPKGGFKFKFIPRTQ